MVPLNPNNKVVVAIETRFQDQVKFDSGIVLHKDTTWKPGWHVTVSGIVQSVPDRMRGVYDIKPGDDIAFSYLAVYSRSFVDNRDDIFYEDNSMHPQVQTWSNRKGMTIMRIYRMNEKWEIVVFDTEKKVYEKEFGGYDVVESVLGKYPFADSTEFIYKNVLPVGGKDYWLVEDQFLFAVNRDSEIIMLNEHVLLEVPPMQEQRTADSGLILLSDLSEKMDHEAHLKVLHVGSNDLGISAGDEVIVDARKMQRYNFWGKDYILQRQDQLIGVV